MATTTPTSSGATSDLNALSGHWAVAALSEHDREWMFGQVGQESQEGTASGPIQRILSACEVAALERLPTAEIVDIDTSAPNPFAREASSQVFNICKMLPAPLSTWKRLLSSSGRQPPLVAVIGWPISTVGMRE